MSLASRCKERDRPGVGFVRLVAAVLLSAIACSSKSSRSADGSAGITQFEDVPPRVYVAKVKNLLVGLAPTGEEVKSVEADPEALGALVDAWMKRPEYRKKMQRFFQLAFQQAQVTSNDFADQVYGQLGRNAATTPLLLQNIEESFARTMVELTETGHPLTDAMTTRKLMMTTALKEFYAFLDVWEIDNL